MLLFYITFVEVLAAQLNGVGSPVRDEQIISNIILTLPTSYSHLVAAWKNVDDIKDSFTTDCSDPKGRANPDAENR